MTVFLLEWNVGKEVAHQRKIFKTKENAYDFALRLLNSARMLGISEYSFHSSITAVDAE